LALGSVRPFVVPAHGAEDAGDIKDKIESIEKKIEAAEAELKSNQGQLQSTLNQITKTISALKATKAELERKTLEIGNIEQRIKLNQTLLSDYLREFYWSEDFGIENLLILRDYWNQSMTQSDNLLTIKDKILAITEETNNLKSDLEKAKSQLNEQKEEHEEALAEKQEEKADIQEEIAETQASISELNEKMGELRSDLNRILGKSYDTGDIKEAIKFANKITGVRKGFLFGVLSMESGGNPEAGRCTFKNSDMSSAREKYFKDICEELDYDYKKRPVSCASKNYPGSGGAMGAAQFMPDTWWGYKSKIANATGHNPPDPWSLIDGVVAMALKLKDAGAANDGKTSIKNPCNGKSVKVSWEVYASMRYLGWTCWGYTNYAPAIQNLANGYDKL
ncbi:MAG: hypothetical protein ACOYS2_03740, partial [Patescibacteria group bacterium]